MTATGKRTAGRPRDAALDEAILAAAERQLGELGYARMTLESIAAGAGTTVPSVRRRFGGKAAIAEAVVQSLRVADLPQPAEPSTGEPSPAEPPRARALALLENFQRNLLRPDAMAIVGSLLSEERRHPELLEIFRERLARPRRALLRQAIADGVAAGQLPPGADPDVLAAMLLGSFYARYIATSDLPDDWPERTLDAVWPAAAVTPAEPASRRR